MKMPRKIFLTQVFGFILCAPLFLAATPASAKGSGNLDPQYKKWLEHDVVYIISNDEKQAFLNTSTNEQKDAFIQHFWDIRNPSIGAPSNSYKDEIFKRIEYANQFFGPPGSDVGWRTDRGKIYITLGEPKQRGKYYNTSQTRPMEIWFYDNANPALPPFFYILFYRKEVGGDFVLYSPNFDGPDKLTTTVLAVNNRQRALQLIDRELGREVARTTLSLVPGEPVDFDGATSSLESDMMLGTIKNLANHPLTKEMIKRNRDLLENVSHRVILNGEYLDVVTATLRDAAGDTNLHYVIRTAKPEDFSIAKQDERYYYSVTVAARVLDAANKVILSDQRELSKYLTEDEFDKIKNKAVGYEGVLPLPPGDYKVEFVLGNKLKQTAFRVEKNISVPSPPSVGFHVSELIPFSSAEHLPVASGTMPFAMAAIKFTPLAGRELTFVPGRDINVMFQIWAPPADPSQFKENKLKVEYGYGRVGYGGDAKSISEEFARNQFDANGSLLTGKKIPTADLRPGNYRMIVTVIDPETQRKSFSAFNFSVSPSFESSAPWDLIDSDREDHGVAERQRADIYRYQDHKADAIKWYEAAVKKNPKDELARTHLTDLYFEKQDLAKIAALYVDMAITKDTDDRSIIKAAESFSKAGNPRKAIQLLESALQLKPATEPLYLALSSYYQATGDTAKAAEFQKKSRALENVTKQ